MEPNNLGSKNSVCRACLKFGDKDIFLIHKETSLPYVNIFTLCTSVEISTEDNLPKQLCQDCLHIILSFYTFKSKVIENDLRLKQILKNEVDTHINDTKLENNLAKSPTVELEARNTSSNIKEHDHVVEHKISGIKPNIPSGPVGDLAEMENVAKDSDSEEDLNHFIEFKDQTYEIGNNLCRCNTCGKILVRRNLKQHYLIHIGKKSYNCDICGKTFLRADHLVIHKRTHTGEKPYSCTVCLKGFKQKGALKAHERIHGDDCPFICHVCGKSFKHDSSLGHHREVHSKETPHTCTICRKGFKNLGYLRIHMRFHSDERPYPCTMCDKKYFTKSHLSVHLKAHNNIFSAKCVICGKGFVRPQHLRLHLRTHTKEKAYACKICSKTFSQQSHVNKHMKIHDRTNLL